MRYVQFGNLSPIANDVALLMRLSSFAFSKFENLRARNRAGHWGDTAQASKSGKQEIAGKNRAFRPDGRIESRADSSRDGKQNP
jgi:hypothetical protein